MHERADTGRPESRKLHELFDKRRTPPPVYESKCDRCSFLKTCLPKGDVKMSP